MSKLGFIGLGIMGALMAAHLIKAGHEVFLNTRSKVPTELLTDKAKACGTIHEVVEQADIIFMMLPDTPDVAKVLFGDNGVASALTKGKTVVDMSSISPMDTKEFAQKSMHWVVTTWMRRFRAVKSGPKPPASPSWWAGLRPRLNL